MQETPRYWVSLQEVIWIFMILHYADFFVIFIFLNFYREFDLLRREISIKLNFSRNIHSSRNMKKRLSRIRNETWYPTIIIEIDRPRLFTDEILTFQCRCSYCCWDDWLMPVCEGAIGHARTWAQLYKVAWICPLGGPFFLVCGSDRAHSPPDSRIPPEASLVTSWSIAATQNTPTPIRMYEVSRRDVTLRHHLRHAKMQWLQIFVS